MDIVNDTLCFHGHNNLHITINMEAVLYIEDFEYGGERFITIVPNDPDAINKTIQLTDNEASKKRELSDVELRGVLTERISKLTKDLSWAQVHLSELRQKMAKQANQ